MHIDDMIAYLTSKGVKNFDKFSETVLDEQVYDMKSEEASQINNEGIRSQLEYVMAGWTNEEDIVAELDRMIEENE